MRKLALLGCCILLTSSCKDPSQNPVDPDTSMRANLKNAVLIALVAEGGGSGQQASRKDLPGVLKDGIPLCEDLTVEQLTEVNDQGDYVNDCESPDPLTYCQDIHPEKLATGRVECQQRPWVTGELLAVDHNGEAFSVLPTLPSWNRVTRVQQSEGALLVTLASPVKLLRSDQTTDYCHVLYYAIDTTSDAIVPYCFEYEYVFTFCFGPEQRFDWTGHQKAELMGVPVNGEDCPYEENLEDFGSSGLAICVVPSACEDRYAPRLDYVHVTPYALFESHYTPDNGTATRIVTGDQEAFYPMAIDYYTKNGILSAGTYYTFDADHNSISGTLSDDLIHMRYLEGRNIVFESGSKILYGFPDQMNGYQNYAQPHDATSIQFDFFDTETLEDGSFIIDLGSQIDRTWNFCASLGDYLFLQESTRFFRVDTRNPHPIIELAYESTGEGSICYADWSVVMNGYAVNSPSAVPFVAYLMKPDGTVTEINAAMLGFNPQEMEILDDQIVITGMEGLTPRRFVINPLATAEGELLVETPTEIIPVKTLIPLQ